MSVLAAAASSDAFCNQAPDQQIRALGHGTPLTEKQLEVALDHCFTKLATVIKHEHDLVRDNAVQLRTIADMQHTLSERDALIRMQSQDVAAHVIIQGQKRKADADVLEENKRYRQAAEQVTTVKRAVEAELMAVRRKNVELEAASIDLQAKNAQLEANISAIQFDCCVCINARPSVLYLPCKHLAVCNQCDVQIRKSKMHCPVCQAAIKTRHKSVHM